MSSDNTPKPGSALKHNKQALLIWICAGIGLCLITYAYFLYERFYPSTDDAYVQAHVITISPQVSGPLAFVHVHNNSYVNKGDVLIDIDPRPFQAALEQASAQLQLSIQQMQADSAAIEVAKANVTKALSMQEVDSKNFERINTLVKHGQASLSTGDSSRGQMQVSSANVIAAQNQLVQAQKALGDIGDRNAAIRQARANLRNAELNLSYTHIVAPASGYITNFELRVGSLVSAQQPLFQLVESAKWYVYANYKETEMRRIRPDQLAKITLDMYPGHTFHGYVDSISAGSGNAFSILPAENSSGNWVKVTQRFPVKIIITDPTPQYPLRVGASSTTKINTVKYKKA